MYLQDAYLLNMKHVASYLMNKDDNVITVGLDDMTKATDHKMYDIKADHITVHGPEGKKISHYWFYGKHIAFWTR